MLNGKANPPPGNPSEMDADCSAVRVLMPSPGSASHHRPLSEADTKGKIIIMRKK